MPRLTRLIRTRQGAAGAATQTGAPAPVNLLLSFDEVVVLLRSQLVASPDRERVLDAFLLAAGLHQMIEDHLHRDVLSLDKAARHLAAIVPRVGPLLATTARGLSGTAFRVRRHRLAERRVAKLRDDVAALLGRLGVDVMQHLLVTDPPAPAVAGDLHVPERGLPRALRSARVRPPNCFEAFDQRPEDCLRLVDRFVERWPDRARSLLVVGLRSSGGYLAPLCAACLKARGYERVAFTTIRPGHRLERAENAAFAELRAVDGLALLVDDPPRTGSQLAASAQMLAELGLPRASIVVLLQLLGSLRSLDSALSSYPSVTLEWPDWAVHDQLAPGAVRRDLADLLVGRALDPPANQAALRVRDVAEAQLVGSPQPSRGHLHAVFQARFVDTDGHDQLRWVCVEGTGLGYFGRRGLLAAESMTGFVPTVYGIRDGLLFRDWLPEDARVTTDDLRAWTAEIGARMAEYVVARSAALATEEDVALGLIGRDGAWESAADLLGHAFGAAKQFVRPLTHATARRLVASDRPTVIDGSMAARHWFYTRTRDAQSLRKVDFLRGTSTGALSSYDPIFDLATAAADAEAHEAPSLEAVLREHYEVLTGGLIEDERWLIYRLVHHVEHYRDALRQAAAADVVPPELFTRVLGTERTMARLHQRAMGQRYFADLNVPADGALCAIDIDGVLETRWAAFPALAPAGALALRALHRHGHRAVLVTGRSLQDVKDRCQAYRLAGGVAEYGSVIYDARSDSATGLIEHIQRADLDALVDVLSDLPRVHVDEAHGHSVRAHVLDSTGHRRGLAREAIDEVLAAAGVRGRVRPVPGDLQTDFVAATVDKGTGLRALAAHLGGPSPARIAFAGGDTASDLPMFAVAEQSFAPRNAAPEVREHARVMRASYGSGLLAAVSQFLGHRPSRCDTCRPSDPRSPDDLVLRTVLSALDGGKARKAAQALALAAQLARIARQR